MNVRRFAYAFALLSAVSIAAHADCVYPQSPGAAPNGSTATKEEMVAYMQGLKKYQTEMGAYRTCVNDDAERRASAVSDKPEEAKKIRDMAAKKHDAAVDEETKRADEFNQQVRAFNAKAKG